jgi:hypothetical protein
MSDRAKVILRIIAFISAVTLIGVALYFAFFRGAPTVVPTADDADTNPTGSLSGAGEAGELPSAGTTTKPGTLPPTQIAAGGSTVVRQLTTSAVLSPTLTASGALAYYDPADGRFYSITNAGEATAISPKQFPAASNVIFSNNADNVILEFPDGSNIVYGFNSGKQVTLPSHWEDFSFSSDGNAIAGKSIGNDASNRSLILTSTDGSQTQVIAALGNNSSKVSVNLSPSSNIVAFSRTGQIQSGFGREEYYLIGLDGQAAGALIVDGSNFSAIWAPDGSHLLYSVADPSNSYSAALWYADSRGDRYGDARVRVNLSTWVEKCTYADASTLYCAAPKTIAEGDGADHSLATAMDNIYRISVPSGKVTLVGYPAVQTHMSNLSLSADGTTLYYLDSDGLLSALRVN